MKATKGQRTQWGDQQLEREIANRQGTHISKNSSGAILIFLFPYSLKLRLRFLYLATLISSPRSSLNLS
jgi:hypothetical protein